MRVEFETNNLPSRTKPWTIDRNLPEPIAREILEFITSILHNDKVIFETQNRRLPGSPFTPRYNWVVYKRVNGMRLLLINAEVATPWNAEILECCGRIVVRGEMEPAAIMHLLRDIAAALACHLTDIRSRKALCNCHTEFYNALANIKC